MRKSSFLVLLIIFSLFSPLGVFLPGSLSHAQTKSSKTFGDKLAESLRERVRQSPAGSSETARVIVNLSDGADPQPLIQALGHGSSSPKHLETLGLVVADVLCAERVVRLAAKGGQGCSVALRGIRRDVAVILEIGRAHEYEGE